MRANERVCFIGGAGHSGSTLLGMALGAHPQVFYAGEARKSIFFGNEKKALRKRMCKVCGPTCEVWTKLDRQEDEDLYEALSRRTRKPIVVDSTKSLAWLTEQSALVTSRGVKAHLLFLGRDGRAVISSGLRKYPEESAEEHTRKWQAQIEATEALAANFPGGEAAVTRVHYEAFVTKPRETLTALTNLLGIAFDEAMMNPWTSEQHPLGGNAGTQSLIEGAQTRVGGALEISGAKKGYYAEHPRGFVLDERWRRELTDDARATFESIASETNQRYAWPREDGDRNKETT